MRLKNKTILISGATSGIGLASAQRAIQEGAFVYFTARNPEALAQTQALLGQQSRGIQCDHASVHQQQSMVSYLQHSAVHLDAVFLNAGNVHHEAFGQWDEQKFDEVFNTNVKGPFFLLQSLLPLLNPGCSVVLCGSTSIHIALPQSSVYAASKIALRSLVKTLSSELLSQQIRFNLLSPGPTQTPALDKIASDESTKLKLRAEIEQLVPLNRMADSSEIADAFIYLASTESRFVIGTELLIDGGVANL